MLAKGGAVSEELERRLSLVEETLAHQSLALEDLDGALNLYRQDLAGLQERFTRMERQLVALIEQLSDGASGATRNF